MGFFMSAVILIALGSTALVLFCYGFLLWYCITSYPVFGTIWAALNLWAFYFVLRAMWRVWVKWHVQAVKVEVPMEQRFDLPSSLD